MKNPVYYSIRTRTIVYEQKMKWTPTKMREAEHPEMIKMHFLPSRSLQSSGSKRHLNNHLQHRYWLQWRKPVEGRVGNFLWAWPNIFVFALLLLGL